MQQERHSRVLLDTARLVDAFEASTSQLFIQPMARRELLIQVLDKFFDLEDIPGFEVLKQEGPELDLNRIGFKDRPPH